MIISDPDEVQSLIRYHANSIVECIDDGGLKPSKQPLLVGTIERMLELAKALGLKVTCEGSVTERLPPTPGDMAALEVYPAQIAVLASAWQVNLDQAWKRLCKIARDRHDPIRTLQFRWGKDEAGVMEALGRTRLGGVVADSSRHDLQDHGEITRDTPVELTPPDPRQFDYSGRCQDGLSVTEYRRASMPYVETGAGHGVVNRRVLLGEDYAHLPRLALELNMSEYAELTPCYQALYWWDRDKYRLITSYREHWGRQP